jgi:hypothetical protein
MGYIAPLPPEPCYYPTPNLAAWKDSHQRRDYRRSRMDRHRRYLEALPWSMTMLGADIRERTRAGRSSAEQAWILDDELTRRFEHRRPRWGMWEAALAWHPFPEL